jgi:hypothetical protein
MNGYTRCAGRHTAEAENYWAAGLTIIAKYGLFFSDDTSAFQIPYVPKN